MSEPPRSFPASDVALHSGWMRRLARALVGDPAAADDVVQEAWTRHGGRGEHGGYLAAVVRSLARRWQRSEHRRAAREQAVARAEGLPSAAEIAARSELAQLLARAVDELAEPYHTTIVLRYYDGLSAAEIARRSGLPAGTVRARLARALELLRERLDRREGGRERWISALLPWTRGSLEPAAALETSVLALGAMKLALVPLLALSGLLFLWRALASDPTSPPPAALASGEARPGGVAPGRVDAPRADGPRDSGREVLARVPPPAAQPVPAPTLDRVRARVVDELGTPLGGGWLRLRDDSGASVTGREAGRVELVRESGELERLAVLSGARLVRVEAGAPGRRTRLLWPFLPEGGSTIELGDVRLEPGGTVHGRVVDEAGLAVEGARVAFGHPFEGDSFAEVAPFRGPPDLDPDPWDGRDSAVLGTSGPGGEFRLDGVPVGYGRAWARTATSLWAFGSPIGVRRGEEVGGIELVVREAAGEVLSGRVVDPEGRPLAGLELTFQEAGGSEGWFTERTDADGAFHFAPRGVAVDVRASPPSWEWEPLLVPGVEPGTHGLVLAFERSRWLQLAVLDERGAPVRDGLVVGLPAGGPMRNSLPRSESLLDGLGHARIRRPAEPLRLRVEAPGYRTRLFGPFDPAEFPERLTVRLEEVAALTGRVLRPDGHPAAGARVSLHRTGAAGGARAAGTPAGTHARLTHQGWGGDRDAFVYLLRVDPVARVTTDGEGRFRLPLPGAGGEGAGEAEESSLEGLGYVSGPASDLRREAPDGAWYVHAALAGEATATSGPLLLDALDLPELELVLPRGGAIAGRLVLADGVSPAGWTVWASDGMAEERSATVAPDGAFTLAELHPGGWQVRAFEPGRRHYPGGGRMVTEREPVPDVVVEAGETVRYVHDARLRARARLAGRLALDGQAPGVGWVVVRTSTPQASITSHETRLDPDGRFELALEPDLATSLHVSLVRDGAQLTVSAKPVIVSGPNEWSVDLATARLEGTLTLPAGDADRFESFVTYEQELGDARVQVQWTPTEGGRFGPILVPAGHGILRGPPRDLARPGEVLAELDLAPGETGRVAPPPR